ncbi:Ras-related protein Rab-39A [Mactra antiquata]
MNGANKITYLKYNIVVMGDPFVGKSSIIERYVHGKYGPCYLQTIGTDYFKKELEIEANPILLYIFDTAGQEDMKTVIRSIYRNAQGILLVFDFSRHQTLRHIREWIDLIRMNCEVMPELLLVGNKVDLKDLKVTEDEAKLMAESLDIRFIKASAKKNQNITESFEQLAKQIFTNRKRLYPPNVITSIRLTNQDKEESSCCF